jgi:hypothetical protein
MKNKIISLRIFLWGLLLISLFWFAWMKIIPTGQFSYQADSFGDNFFIGKLNPKERIASQNIIIGDPVYFSLYTPRRFDKAQIKIQYKNETQRNLVELGVMVGDKNWGYRLEPLENKILDNLSSDWDKLTEGDLTLWQRDKKYNNIKTFKEDLPNREKIALYNTKINDEYLLEDYQANGSIKNLQTPIRGRYGFYTYIKDENLNWDFNFVDLNKNKNSDEVDIDLYYGDQLIQSWHLEDDGNVFDNGQKSEERGLKLDLANLPEGVYKIEVRANDDIVTKNISTIQSKLAFYGTLHLAKTKMDNKFTLFTDAQEVAVKTISPDSLQKIYIDNQVLNLEETYKQFSTRINSADISEINFAKDSLIIATDGVLAFSRSELINPNFKKVNDNLNFDNIDYILANYTANKSLDRGKLATIELNLADAYREKGRYGFIISIPGLEPHQGEKFEINNIQINLSGKSLLNKIKEIF